MLRSYLEREGLVVLSTGSGAEAIALAHDTAPELIVFDLEAMWRRWNVPRATMCR